MTNEIKTGVLCGQRKVLTYTEELACENLNHSGLSDSIKEPSLNNSYKEELKIHPTTV